MSSVRLLPPVLCGALTLTALRCQETPTTDELLASWRALDAGKRAAVLGAIERRLQTDADPILQRFSARLRGLAAYPPLGKPVHFDPAQLAPAAPPRTVVARDSAAGRAAAAQFHKPPFLDDLACAVVYDWAAGKAARCKDSLGPDEQFANLARGYPLGADQAVAQVLELLDDDPEQRQLAEYFEHLYADRDGHVFAGISLFDAYASGKLVEMPDVEAIAYARQFLATQSFVSPIPADRRRERLYQKIHAAMDEHRQVRTLRLVAAATFVRAAPSVDPTWQPLVDRCHYLWGECDFDPKAMAKRLHDGKDRRALLATIDQQLAHSEVAIAQRDASKKQLADLAIFLRELAAFELKRVQGQ